MNQNLRTRTARRRAPRDGGTLTTVDVSRQLDALEAAKKSGVLTVREYDQKRTPLLNALAELDAAEQQALTAGGVPLSVTIGTPLVVAGELIESAWGNQVRTDLLALNSGKLETTGGTLSGHLNLPTGPSAGQATRKDYVDTQDALKANLTGATFSGQVSINQDADIGAGISLESGGRIHSHNNTSDLANLTCERTISTAIDAGERFITFVRAGSVIGSITIATATTTGYVTTSDPRAKHRTGAADGAAALVQQLGARAYRGRWLDDDGDPSGDEWVLLNSTDVEQFAPYAVHGEADAVDDNGKPVFQMVDWPALVPMLFAGQAEDTDRIEVLEAALSQALDRIEVLEAAAG